MRPQHFSSETVLAGKQERGALKSGKKDRYEVNEQRCQCPIHPRHFF